MEIAALFKTFDKLVRTLRLYGGRGEVIDRILEDVTVKAIDATARGTVTVGLAPFGLVYGSQPLWSGERRAPYLFRLFCDGLRELTFTAGITKDELRSLALTLGDERQIEGEDFVTRLWSRGLDHVTYYATDAFAAGMEIGEEGDVAITRHASHLASTTGELGVQLAADDLRMIDADTRLLWVEGCSAPPLAPPDNEPHIEPLRAGFQTASDPARFLGIVLGTATDVPPVAMVTDLIDDNIQDGPVLIALLTALAQAAHRGNPTAAAVFDAAMTAERLVALAPIFDANADALLTVLTIRAAVDAEALVALLEALSDPAAAGLLRSRLESANVDMTHYYDQILQGGGEAEALEAVGALSGQRGPRVAAALCKALSSPSDAVREAALTGLRGRYDDAIRADVGRALSDSVRSHRLLAVEILSRSADNRVLGPLMAVVESEAFLHRDEGEQGAFFAAIALFRDDRSVNYFDRVLSEKNITRKRSALARQLLAVRALAAMGTPQARLSLSNAGRKWFHPPQIRDAVEAALTS